MMGFLLESRCDRCGFIVARQDMREGIDLDVAIAGAKAHKCGYCGVEPQLPERPTYTAYFLNTGHALSPGAKYGNAAECFRNAARHSLRLRLTRTHAYSEEQLQKCLVGWAMDIGDADSIPGLTGKSCDAWGVYENNPFRSSEKGRKSKEFNAHTELKKAGLLPYYQLAYELCRITI